MSRLNFGGTLFPSVDNQHPQKYWQLDDKWPQYVQVQRTPARISDKTINFKLNSFDPNTFLKSKAYIKIRVAIQKREFETDAKGEPVVDIASNYVAEDRIYKKPGMVLHNACTHAVLRLNSHTIEYKDLRYITEKMNSSFAGKTINDRYLSTSGSNYEDYNGVYEEHGDIYKVGYNSLDLNEIDFRTLNFVLGAGNNTIEFTQATNSLEFTAGGGGNVIDLTLNNLFVPGDSIALTGGEGFRINGLINLSTANAVRLDANGDLAAQDLLLTDSIFRARNNSFDGDNGRQHAYDDVFQDILVGDTDSTFRFLEPLSFGIFNHLADYKNDIYSGSWNRKQSSLIPYITELELSMTFKNIAANSLIYQYGRLNNDPTVVDPVNPRSCRLVDLNILDAELVLFWVKPRDEILLDMPHTVRIQSWQYDHKQFGLGLIPDSTRAIYSENNIYTQQIPSYILLYAMVDKDSDAYQCQAVFTDSNGENLFSTISTSINSVESGASPSASPSPAVTGADLTIRSNTLGGDDILDTKYTEPELYRLTLKNSVADFPYSKNVFRSNLLGDSVFANYPGNFYLLLGEQELNSFFIRKGQMIRSYVLSFNGQWTISDGYSIRKILQGGNLNGGTKTYAMHIFYIYDRYGITLSSDGHVEASFDARFF